jgi:hypothetical protein
VVNPAIGTDFLIPLVLRQAHTDRLSGITIYDQAHLMALNQWRSFDGAHLMALI